MERKLRDLDADLEVHRRDAYAHGPMIGRIMQENLTLRERFENRLRNLENWRWWVIGIGALLVFEVPLALVVVAFYLK